MATNLQQISLLDMLPPSIKNDPQVQAAAKALDNELQATTAAIKQTIIIPRINELPEDMLDLLAWQFHVDFYEPIGMDINTKRALVLKSIDWHKRKGTPSVVQEIVSSVLSSGEVREWFEYGGQPYHFRVQTDEVLNSQTIYDRLTKLINAVKNTRSRLESIIIKRKWSGSLFIGGALYSGKNIAISPSKFVINDLSAPLFIGGVVLSGKRITINPERYMINARGETALQIGGALLSGKTITIQ